MEFSRVLLDEALRVWRCITLGDYSTDHSVQCPEHVDTLKLGTHAAVLCLSHAGSPHLRGKSQKPTYSTEHWATVGWRTMALNPVSH